ncbi:hypothetical protein BRD00_12515 [Halobacteriales archaeon QS_8_69_26]|nr:MAG: hypothetical protein BRD00_12515 [Halobacteriales archaeon QS_8_69_26]
MPRRRTYLALLAGALAGCSTGPDGSGTAGSPTGGTPTPSTGADRSTTSPPGTERPTTTEPSTTVTDIERLPAEDPALAWAVNVPDEVQHGPAVDPERDRVYLGAGDATVPTPTDGSGGGTLVALGTANGDLAWREDTGAAVARPPVVHDGRVHAVTGYSTGHRGIDQQVRAYDPGGTELWTTEPRTEFLDVVAADGGTLYVGSADDNLEFDGQRLFSLGPDGDVRWEREAGDTSGGTVAGGRLLYRVGVSGLASYVPTDGTERWTVRGRPLGNPTTDVAAFGGRCFLRDRTEEGTAMVARSITDGSEEWRYERAVADGSFRPAGVANVPQDVDGANDDKPIVVAGEGGTVTALDDGGTELWAFAADGEIWSGPVVGDAVYVADRQGTVYALEPYDGSERWRASVPDGSAVLPHSGGVLAYGSGDGWIAASFAPDGSERWRYGTSRPMGRPTVVDGRVYAAGSDGTVLAFEGD